MTRTGVVFRPQSPPEDLHAAVDAAESAGVDEMWVWEDCFLEGGLTTATAALAWSRRLTVGIGLLPVPLRNPALAAMEIATVARLFPGRLAVALGHGVQDWMRQVGAAVDSPMTLLGEHVEAVRRLLDGETVSASGRYVGLDSVALDWPPTPRPRLLVGARGPRTVTLAGQLADGVLLDSVSSVEVVAAARAAVGDAEISVFTEVPGDHLDTGVARWVDRWVGELADAGADAVVFQGPADDPGVPRLLAALGW